MKLRDVFIETSPSELEPLLKLMPSDPAQPADLSALENLCKDFGSQSSYAPAVGHQSPHLAAPAEVNGVHREALDKVCTLHPTVVGNSWIVEGKLGSGIANNVAQATGPIQPMGEDRIKECQIALMTEAKRQDSLKLLADVGGKALSQLGAVSPEFQKTAENAKKIVEDASSHPLVKSAQEWAEYEKRLASWNAGGGIGTQPPEPDKNLFPKPKTYCERLEDADQKRSLAYEYNCKNNKSVVPAPVDMKKLPAFDPYGSLPTCQDPPNTQGVRLGMFQTYMKILQGAGKAASLSVHRREWYSDAMEWVTGNCRINRKAQMWADVATSDGQTLRYDSCIEGIQETESELGQAVNPYPPPCDEDSAWEDQWHQIY